MIDKRFQIVEDQFEEVAKRLGGWLERCAVSNIGGHIVEQIRELRREIASEEQEGTISESGSARHLDAESENVAAHMEKSSGEA